MTVSEDVNPNENTKFADAPLGHDLTANDVSKQIQEQLKKLEKDCDLTSGSDFFMEKQWENWNLKLGIATVILSALVSVIGAVSALDYFKASEEYFLLGSTLLASIGTVLGSVLTFLKPSERAARYREFAIKQKNLRNRIRIYRTVHAPKEPEWTKSAEQLASFNMEKDALSSDNPTIPTVAYENSRLAIKAKEAKQAD
jgi:hypothetical protein